jgi:hypothetical protein
VRLLPRILAEDEDDCGAEGPETEPQPEAEPRTRSLPWQWTAGVAAIAAVPRLLYLFVFTDPENPGLGAYNDVWHHWQIAYLTKQVGLTAPDGPRLWDLKGLEYFWGILHPLMLAGLFTVTGSVDIVIARLLSLVFGVLVVVLLFRICMRLWGVHVALGAALVASLLPTSVMNDASGMTEPVGVALCLLGIWAWPRRGGFWAGLAFGLATMARAEAWIFSLGMVVAAFLRRTGWSQRVPLVAGFGAVMLVYMKALLDRTGDPIYPLWWNFLANAVGHWEATAVNAGQATVRPVLGIALLAAVAGLAWSLWKRPPAYMLLTYGFGYWVFVAGMLGFTSYLASWVWWMPITRVFAFPYVFAGVLVAVALLWWLPLRFGGRGRALGWSGVVVVLVAAQLLWIPIAQVFRPTERNWQATLADSRQLGDLYNQAPYRGHAIAVPSDRPDITYGLARFGGVEGRHLVSEMYDAFAYLPGGYTYAPHQQTVDVLVECWIAKADIRMIAVPANDSNYRQLLQAHPEWFTPLGQMSGTLWLVYGVSAPQPTQVQCEEASRATSA